MAIFSAIGAAIGAAVSWAASLGVVGSFLLRTAVGVGLSALSKKLAGKVGAESSPFVVQGSMQSGGTVPRSFMLGPSLTAGSLVWHTEWGEGNDTSNAFYTQVIALSDLPVAGLRTWFIDGRAVTLSAVEGDKGFVAQEYTADGKDHAWIKFYDGTQTAAPDFLTTTVSAGAPRDYSADRVGTGVAYAVVTFRVNQELFSGFPQSKFVLDGVPLYDVSKDSSEGGDGDQRWNDPATWGGDGDQLPAVQAYNLSRGISYGGKWFYGLQGMTSARLPAAHWIGQIEKCRALVQGDGGLEPIYRSAGEIAVNAEIGSAIEEILTTCAGRMSEVGGVFKIYVGAPDAPIAHFTDDDIVSLSSQSFTPFFGLSDTVNGVVATYPSPEDGYEMTATPPLYNAAYEVEDGGRRLLTSVALTFVPFKVQAQRLLKGELAAARRARRYTFTLPAKFRLLEPGDVVTWSSVRNGYDGKQFRVDGVIDLPNCDLIVDMTEVDPTDHGDFDFDNDYTPVNPAPMLPVRPTAQGVIGFAPEPLVIVDGEEAARRPALLMKWNPSVTDIAGIMFEVRLASEGAASEVIVSKAETRDFAKGELPIESGLVGSTLYEVRAKYIPGSPRAVDWTSWVPVATPDVKFGYADLAQEITDAIIETQAEIAEMVGIKPVASLPGEGEKPDQIVVLPDGVLYRWDAVAREWTRNLFGGVKPGDVDVASFAAGLEPVKIVSSPTLPTVKSTTAIVWGGKLYRWNGSAYTAAVPTTDLSGQITGVQISNNAVTAEKIAANSVTSAKIQAGAVTANELAANSVTTAKLQAGAVTAAEIAAGAITADKMLIGDTTNLFDDPDLGLLYDSFLWRCEDGPNNSGSYNAYTSTWESYDVPRVLRIPIGVDATGGSGYRVIFRPRESGGIPVTAGREYLFSCLCGTNSGADPSLTNTGARLRVYAYKRDDSGNLVYSRSVASAVSYGAANTRMSVNFVPAFGEVAVALAFSAYSTGGNTDRHVVFNNPRFTAKASGELIVDGGITAEKVSAGAITTNALAANAVIASKIAAGAVTANKMSVTTLSAITATIGILRTATSGARMEVHTDKILVFDASNALRVKIGNLS